MTTQGSVQDIADQCAFSGTTHSRNYGNDIQRELDINAFEVVGTGALNLNISVPMPASSWDTDLFLSQEIAYGMAVASFLEFFCVTFIDNSSSELSCTWSNVNDIISCTDYFLVMFYDNDGVA